MQLRSLRLLTSLQYAEAAEEEEVGTNDEDEDEEAFRSRFLLSSFRRCCWNKTCNLQNVRCICNTVQSA